MNGRLLPLLILSMLFMAYCFHETTSSVTIPVRAESLSSIIANYAYVAAGSEGYLPPSSQELSDFEQVLSRFVNNDFSNAFLLAPGIGYELTQIADSTFTAPLFCLLESSSIRGRGIYCHLSNASREYHISVPHPLYDVNTNTEGEIIFRSTGARFFSVSTTHRCASSASSACSGTTSACGAAGSYKVSDMAHNINTFFDVFTRKVHTMTNAITVQLHGCGSSSCPSGTGSDIVARLSVGSTNSLPTSEKINMLNSALKSDVASNKPGATTRSCNLAGEPDYLLCAETNVQGRYINGQTTSPCTVSATDYSNSRFVHIEQNTDLREFSGGSDPIQPQLLISNVLKFY